MKIAIPNGDKYDGVKLLKDGVFPYPENAIYPIDNWDDLIKVPEIYRIVDGTRVREMTDAEKTIVDNKRLPELIKEKIDLIVDRLHDELLPAGFEFDGKRFSLKKDDISFWSSIAISMDLLKIANFPVNIADIYGDPYVLESLDHYKKWYGKGQYVINTYYSQTRDLVQKCKASKTIDELNAVVDYRKIIS